MVKIFYTAAGGSSDPKLDDLVIHKAPAALRKLGHIVDVNIYNPDDVTTDQKMQDIAQKILAADVFIGEMSRASQTLGFELAFALNNSKPCLYLYHADRKAQPGALLLHNPSRLLRIRSYHEKQLDVVLKSFITSAGKQLFSARTSFMSTVKIDTYLNHESKQRGISKGELIREILSERLDDQK